jgi:hypothetical protein
MRPTLLPAQFFFFSFLTHAAKTSKPTVLLFGRHVELWWAQNSPLHFQKKCRCFFLSSALTVHELACTRTKGMETQHALSSPARLAAETGLQ